MQKTFEQLSRLWTRHWQALSSFAAVFTVVAGALAWKLGSLQGGYSLHEQQTYLSSVSLASIWQNPLNAPYHIIVHFLSYITPDKLLATRLTSITIAWLMLIMFAILTYRWFGTRTAVIGTLIFGTSSIFLHVARLGTPDSVFMGIVTLVGLGVWLREQKAGLAVITGLLISGALLYTPGMIWLVIAALLWQWKHIDSAFKKHLTSVSLGALGFLAIIAPLGYKFYKAPGLIKTWLCLPQDWSHPLHFLHNLVDVPLAFFFRGQTNPETWLGRLPILSVFGVVAFSLGTYIFIQNYKLGRVKFFATLGLIGSLLIALSNGAIPLIVLVPFAYIVVAVGADRMIQLWLQVFPRNPLARWTGIVLFAAAVGLTCTYNIRSYFVAWPQADVTRAVFPVARDANN